MTSSSSIVCLINDLMETMRTRSCCREENTLPIRIEESINNCIKELEKLKELLEEYQKTKSTPTQAGGSTFAAAKRIAAAKAKRIAEEAKKTAEEAAIKGIKNQPAANMALNIVNSPEVQQMLKTGQQMLAKKPAQESAQESGQETTQEPGQEPATAQEPTTAKEPTEQKKTKQETTEQKKTEQDTTEPETTQATTAATQDLITNIDKLIEGIKAFNTIKKGGKVKNKKKKNKNKNKKNKNKKKNTKRRSIPTNKTKKNKQI